MNTKFRDLRVGDRFRFVTGPRHRRILFGRYIKTSERSFRDESNSHVTGTSTPAEPVEKLPPPPTQEEIDEVAGVIRRRDAGVK